MPVTVFENPDFQGTSITLDIGSHRLLAPADLNDAISSIRVPSGLVALVSEHADDVGGFGRSADFMEDCPDLGRIGLGGTISFVEVFSAQRDVVVRNHGTGTTETSQMTWARGSLVNGQYVAGHWERPRAQGAATPGPVVVSPGPQPHLLQIARLDGTPCTNPPFDTSAADWSSAVVGGATFDGSDSHSQEWVSVLNPTIEQDDEVGIAGFALEPEVSGADLPFTHPFGPDFEYAIDPDPEYLGLLAPSNHDPNGTYRGAWPDARRLGLAAPVGVLGMEVDGPLVPPEYRAAAGDRVALYGRWIVDAGHEDFHAEIHPPLLMARARAVNNQGDPTYPTADATTELRLWSRPSQAAQRFTDGDSTNLSLVSYLTNISAPLGDIRAYPPVFAKPLDGVHIVSFTVKAPVPSAPRGGPLAGLSHLECSYSFTVNHACGIQIQQSPNDPDAVIIILALNSAGYPALPELPSTFDKFLIDDLVKQVPSDLGTLSNFLVEAVKAYQSKFGLSEADIFVRRFAGPAAPDLTSHAVPFTSLADLPRSSVNVDNTQPFPVLGWLKLRWADTTGGVLGHFDPGVFKQITTTVRIPRLATFKGTTSGGTP